MLKLKESVLLLHCSQDPWKPYWAAQQRFFKLLCVSLKVRARADVGTT